MIAFSPPTMTFAGVSGPFKFDWRFFVAEVTVADSDFLRSTLKTREKFGEKLENKINPQFVTNFNLRTLKIAFRGTLHPFIVVGSCTRNSAPTTNDGEPSNDAVFRERREFSALALHSVRWKVACAFYIERFSTLCLCFLLFSVSLEFLNHSDLHL